MKRVAYAASLGAATAFPATGLPGDIYLGQAGAILDVIAIVGHDGVPVELITNNDFVPSNDNATDLGRVDRRFKQLFLGGGIVNPAGNLEIDVNDVGTTTLVIRNGTLNQVCNVSTDGSLTAGPFGGGNATLTTPVANTALLGTGQAAGLRVTSSGGVDVNGAEIVTSVANGTVEFAAIGADADIVLGFRPKGTDALILRGGAGAARVSVNNTGLGFFDSAPIAQPAVINDCVVDADGTSAGTQLNLLLAQIRLLGLIDT